MLLRVFPIFLVLFPRLGSTSPSNTTHNGTNGAVFPRAYPRDVYLIIEFKPDGGTWLSSDPIEVFPSHSFLYVTGTEQDGPLKIEISTDTTLPYDQALHIRVLDLTPANRDKVYIDNPDAGRAVVWQAGVSYSNRDFIDPETGSGFAAKAWAYDNVYRTGTGNFGRINTCNTFLQRLIEDNIGVQIHPRAWSYYMKAKKWTEEINLKGETTVIKELRLVTANTAGGPNFKRSWEISPLCAPHKSKRAGTCDAKVVPTDGESSSKVEPSSEQNELARDPIASSLPDSELNLDQDDTAVVDRATAASAEASISKVQKSKVVLARAGGKLTAYLAVGKEALTALNVAGSVAGAIFVILDFVEHNWVGGAVGAAGALAGVAIGFAVTGPLGWIIGGAVAGLFASKRSSLHVFALTI